MRARPVTGQTSAAARAQAEHRRRLLVRQRRAGHPAGRAVPQASRWIAASCGCQPGGPQRHRRGWVSREPILGRHTGIITVNGLFRPITLVQGRAVATWSLPDGVVRLDRLVELPAAAQEALAAGAADVRRFLGLGSEVRLDRVGPRRVRGREAQLDAGALRPPADGRSCRSRSRPMATGRGRSAEEEGSLRRLRRVNGWPGFSGRVVAAVTMTSTAWSLIRRGRPPAH
jgi:hypothetical protein